MKYMNFKTAAILFSTIVVLGLAGCDGTDGIASDAQLAGDETGQLPANKPPVADAGDDQNVTEGSSVTLDGSASYDIDGTIVSYKWMEGSTVLSTDVSFNKTDYPVGTHTITLTVSDDDGATGTDSVSVTVNVAENIPPVADAGPSQTIGICDTLELDGSGSHDDDGDIVQYVWTVGEGEIIGEGETVSLPPVSSRTPGEHNITLTVTDDQGATATDIVTVTVNGADEDYDFSYIVKDPNTLNSLYIDNIVNAETYSESDVVAYKPIVGGTTYSNTEPGVIGLKFTFPENVEVAYLFTRIDSFHWSYSEGHTYLDGYDEGTNSWIALAEAPPPAYGEWNGATYNDFLSDSMIGTTDITIRARLYSYGSSAPSGGIWTNTAQFMRYSPSNDNTTFKLNVCYEGTEEASE